LKSHQLVFHGAEFHIHLKKKRKEKKRKEKKRKEKGA
jgi:hypothetical protein